MAAVLGASVMAAAISPWSDDSGRTGVITTGAAADVASSTTSAPTSTSTTVVTDTSVVTPETPPTTAAPSPPPPRHIVEQDPLPYAVAAGITLFHPARVIERVAFHQSNHEGARPQAAQPTAILPTVLEARERLTDATTAADIVVAPTTAIVAPVTGTVKRAGSYVLYCKYRDDFVVIEPAGRPGFEVKILHIDGEQATPGQRVEAGVTVLAPRATPLPFASQVDDLRTADPAWPHVHIEVVDTSIPNVPSPGGGAGC